jgi:type-F conjugative transfer system pilin assembly protein TrbC
MQKLAAKKIDPQMMKMLEDMQGNAECCGSKSITQEQSQPSAQNTQTLYIFMSFSVPKQVWLDLWKQVDRYPFQFVLNGLPDNSFKKLANKIKEYGCPVTINPSLFTKFGVTAVPTFVLVDKGTVKAVSGNISLEYAMQHLSCDNLT